MKRNVQKGFTLIELMIVIAIVAILVALAVPAYKDYTIRAKVAECINGAAVAKLQVSEFYLTTDTWPTDANQAGLGAVGGHAGTGDTRYCEAISYVGAGVYTINIDEGAVGVSGNLAATMSPTVASATISGVDWACTNGGDAGLAKYLPSNCRG